MLYHRPFCLLRWDSANGDQHHDVRGYVPVRQNVWTRFVGFWSSDACSRYDNHVHACTSAHINTCTCTRASAGIRAHAHAHAQAQSRAHTQTYSINPLPLPNHHHHIVSGIFQACGGQSVSRRESEQAKMQREQQELQHMM